MIRRKQKSIMIIVLHIFLFLSTKEVKKLAAIVSLCFHAEKRTNKEEKHEARTFIKNQKKRKASQYLLINSSFFILKKHQQIDSNIFSRSNLRRVHLRLLNLSFFLHKRKIIKRKIVFNRFSKKQSEENFYLSPKDLFDNEFNTSWLWLRWLFAGALRITNGLLDILGECRKRWCFLLLRRHIRRRWVTARRRFARLTRPGGRRFWWLCCWRRL